MPKTYLAHHGIKGQRWGVRRFQNEDGSLTAAGRKKYYVNSDGTMVKSARYRKKQARSGLVKAAIGGSMALKTVPKLLNAAKKYSSGKKTGIPAAFKRNELKKTVFGVVISSIVVGSAVKSFVNSMGSKPINTVGRGGTPEIFEGKPKTRNQVLAKQKRDKAKV